MMMTTSVITYIKFSRAPYLGDTKKSVLFFGCCPRVCQSILQLGRNDETVDSFRVPIRIFALLIFDSPLLTLQVSIEGCHIIQNIKKPRVWLNVSIHWTDKKQRVAHCWAMWHGIVKTIKYRVATRRSFGNPEWACPTVWLDSSALGSDATCWND